MSSQKLIVVFGATGAQGGSVANALIKDANYRLRLVSRNVDNPKLQIYKDQGAEVVWADLDDPASLLQALKGAYGTFIITNYSSRLGGDKETAQGINAVKAAIQCGLKHIIYSGLENSKRLYGIEAQIFDSKGRVEDYLEQNQYPFTSLRLSFYYDNWLNHMAPNKVAENTYVLHLPMGNQPLIGVAVDDIGPAVLGILNNRDQYLGKFVGLVGSIMPPSEYAHIMGKVFPDKKFSQSTLTSQEMAAQGWPEAADVAAMFDLFATGKIIRSLPDSKALHPAIMDFETWLVANKEKFAAVLS